MRRASVMDRALIEKTARLLDAVNWAAYGTHQAADYLAYVEGKHGDERELMDFQAIRAACQAPQSAALDLDDSVRRLCTIVALLHEDVRQQSHYKPEREITAATLKPLLAARADTPDGQAVDRYAYRVAYFAMTRILLARVWEDIGFIDQVLYDGGFAHWYAYFNREIQRVLRQAFHFAEERYTWLYGAENNYTWYTPSEAVLADVLYEFSRFDFRALDADVLGSVYEAYLDETDRKNKGQYYTPRAVVQFIWDRVGFDAPDRIFRFEKGARQPRVVADFCTGSGGFLVEAARRIREAVLGPAFDPADPTALAGISLDDLTLAMLAIIEGLRGAEINAFAYYLTEVNLLIQLTPIIAAIQKKAPRAHRFGRDFALSVLHQDALKLHNRLQPTLIDNGERRVAEFTQADEVYEEDRRHDIVPFTGFKRVVYDWLKEGREVDYICSNPPYVGEKGHKEMFRYYRHNFEYWDTYYQGKMDFLYWFIILGLSKLRDGGRLAYITTSYWPTADGARKLRQYILDHAKIIEMIDFGETRIFSDAPGQHNMIIVLERCDDKTARAAHYPRIIKVKRGIETEAQSFQERLEAVLARIPNRYLAESAQYADDVIAMFQYPVPQAAMGSQAWSVSISSDTHNLLAQIQAGAKPLSDVCQFDQGVQSNADRLARSKQRLVVDGDYPVGAPIFVLTQSELDRLHLTDAERAICKPFYKNSDITPYLANYSGKEQVWILYVTHDVDIETLPNIKRHLLPFKAILEARDTTYGRSKHWYELHCARDAAIFEQAHLACPRRAQTNRFAYVGPGHYENSDISLLTPLEETREHLKYLLALLNSRVLTFWSRHKHTRYGQMCGYYGRDLKRMPIRRIRFEPPTAETVKQAALAALNAGLDAGDYDAAYESLRQALASGQEDVVHDGLVALVEQIIALKTALADYNPYFDARLTRLEEGDPLPEIDPLAVVRGMPDAEQWSLGIHIQHGTLTVQEQLAGPRDAFYFYRMQSAGADHITLRAKGRDADTLTLRGDAALIAYLQRALPAQREQAWREVKALLVPRTMPEYTRATARITRQVATLRARIAGRQAVIDQTALDLYGIGEPEARARILAPGAAHNFVV